MVTQGKTPDEISKHFNIAVSSVHNYKRELKKKGVDIPDIRGKRPGDDYHRKPVKAIAAAVPVKKDTVLKSSYITVTVNDVVFKVDSRAKAVTIGQDELHVSF
jgi:hypothetical protein